LQILVFFFANFYVCGGAPTVRFAPVVPWAKAGPGQELLSHLRNVARHSRVYSRQFAVKCARSCAILPLPGNQLVLHRHPWITNTPFAFRSHSEQLDHLFYIETYTVELDYVMKGTETLYRYKRASL
jgi:hypothetical protein